MSKEEIEKYQDALNYMKCIRLDEENITISWDGGKTWYRGEKIE